LDSTPPTGCWPWRAVWLKAPGDRHWIRRRILPLVTGGVALGGGEELQTLRGVVGSKLLHADAS